MPQGFRTFVERQDADSLYTSLRKETMSKRILAASKLEDESARVFLRTARNAHQEGYAAKLLTGHTNRGTCRFNVSKTPVWSNAKSRSVAARLVTRCFVCRIRTRSPL